MLGLLAIPARAQETPRIRAQRDELTRIRLERAELERQMRDLQTTAHDLREEVTNLKQRADVTARLIRTLDNQLVVIDGDIQAASANMVHAENELSEKKQVLRHRLVEIYKRGPLFTTQALLSAESFGDLVARYKYLHMLALRDRSLVKRVEVLRNQVGMERDRLVLLQRGLANNRGEKRLEEDRLRGLEQEQRAELAQVQSQTRQTQNRIARMKIAETQLSNTISALETERRRVEAARPASAPRAASTIKTSDYGRLDWPVEGPLVYTYGRAVQQNNTAIRWNGVGIEAKEGTAVRSVAAGRVVSVRQLGTYGLTVIMEHGAGDYSVYGSLSRADVREGQLVPKGQIIGGVGISDPELPPHLHFEIRHGGPAMDPAAWLRRR
ncbi:MAG TPA: peptidoglycan DD-metalloendopeptidase family protein [Gemmatimonadaceae bacterium]|nr:peptidoglycan DD-metalloendopeptidase family protein [Gemmatimonadaceae bacterium]